MGRVLYYSIEYFVALVLAELLEFLGQAGILQGQYGDRKEGSILGTVDGHGGHGDAGGHLNDGQEGIPAGEGLGFHRNADDREGGVCGDDSGEVGGTAGAGDDNLTTFFPLTI